MGFLTEASVNLADHEELRELMVEAGFKKVFLGIETPSAAGIEECGKTQNAGAIWPLPCARCSTVAWK